MDRLTSELLNALFWFQFLSAGKSVFGISHLRSDQVEIMHFQVLDYENLSSMLRKIIFGGFRETIMSRVFCFSERLRIYPLKPGINSLLFWWVAFPELFSVPSSLILSFKLVVSLYWLISISAFNILYQYYCSALTHCSTVLYYCK